MNKEKLKQKLEQIIEKNASVGVHCPRKTDILSESDIYNKVIDNGIYAKGGERKWHGITSTFAMCGQNGLDFNFDHLYNWNYGDINKKDNYQIIIAIPDVIKNSVGQDFILGCWKYKKDFYESEKESNKMPYNGIDIIPPEFIVGAIVWDDVKTEKDVDYIWKKGNERLVINPKYIGLKSEDEKKMFYDEYAKTLLNKNKVIEVIEENLNLIQKEKEEDFIPDDLYQLFMKTYNKSIKNVRKQDNISDKIVPEEISNYLNSENFYNKIKNLYSVIDSKYDLQDTLEKITAHLIEYYLLFRKDKNISDLDNFCNEIVNAYIECFKKNFRFNLDTSIIDDIYKSEFNNINIYDETQIFKYIMNNLNNDYIFHAFSSLSLDSIREYGIAPNRRNLPVDEINEIDEIFRKNGVTREDAVGIFGWYKINCENQVFYSSHPNVSYRYAIDSPEWFNQFVGGATIYGKEGNDNLRTNNYDKAYNCITKVMNEYNFSELDKTKVINFLKKYWNVYANKKPMLFIKNTMPSGLKEETDKVIYKLFNEGSTHTINHCMNICLNPSGCDGRTTNIISPENSEIIELTDYQKIYNYINNNEYAKDIEEYKDFDYIDFDFKSIYKYFENKDLNVLVDSYIFYGGLQEKIALDIENTGKKYDKVKNLIENDSSISINYLEKSKNELQTYQSNMDKSLEKYNDLTFLKWHIIRLIENSFDLMSENEKENFVSYLESIKFNNNNKLKQNICNYLHFNFYAIYEKSKENNIKK